jgi:hypothetical protein
LLELCAVLCSALLSGSLTCAVVTRAPGLCITWVPAGGKYGQLGHSHTTQDELEPRLVASLRGKRVVGAACGWLHTALLIGAAA